MNRFMKNKAYYSELGFNTDLFKQLYPLSYFRSREVVFLPETGNFAADDQLSTETMLVEEMETWKTCLSSVKSKELVRLFPV